MLNFSEAFKNISMKIKDSIHMKYRVFLIFCNSELATKCYLFFDYFSNIAMRCAHGLD